MQEEHPSTPGIGKKRGTDPNLPRPEAGRGRAVAGWGWNADFPSLEGPRPGWSSLGWWEVG